MSERVIANSNDGSFRGQYGGGVPGHALLTVSDGWDVANDFFDSDQLMSIARLCTELAQEIEHDAG